MLPPRGWHWKGSDYDAGLLWAQLPNFSPHPRHPPPAVSSSRYCNRLPRPVFQLASSPRPGQGVLGGVAGAPGSHTSSPARPEMLLPPGHPALLLLVGMLLGAAAQDPGYTITQPKSLSAPAGGSVTLPCAFTYPAEIEPLRDLRVHWRRGGFHGEFIYNHTERFTHWDYRGRIALVGDPRGNRTASICIDQLRESDASDLRPSLDDTRPLHGTGTDPSHSHDAAASRAGGSPGDWGGAGGGRPAGRDHRAGRVWSPEENRRSEEGPLSPEGAWPVAGRRRRRVHGDRGARAGRPPTPAPPRPPGTRLALRCPGLHQARHCPEATRAPWGPHG
ncbi:uncharacterized protein ACDP82_021333 isoform 2-T2 [Pangshura tecta]